LVGVAGIAGCMGGENGDEEVDDVDEDVINVWHAMGGGSGDLLDDMVERFDGAEAESEYQGSYEDVLNSLFGAILPAFVRSSSLREAVGTSPTSPLR
jgi:sn-glycerol 3-phosphate transport system substrate-binding protein